MLPSFSQTGVDARATEDLLWHWGGDADAAMGLSSNYDAMVAACQAQGDARWTRESDSWNVLVCHAARSASVGVTEPDERRLEAATRDRMVRRALERLSARDLRMLYAALGPAVRYLPQFGAATGIVHLTRSAQEAHRLSRTTRSLAEWLVRLCCRADARDRRVLKAIGEDAHELLAAALQAFAAARYGPQRRRRRAA